VKRGEDKNIKVSFQGGAVGAPVNAGQTVGAIVVQNGSEVLARVPAVAGNAVGKQAWYKSFLP
jgi:D-alanyl-D-alanine carboxypeptidase